MEGEALRLGKDAVPREGDEQVLDLVRVDLGIGELGDGGGQGIEGGGLVDDAVRPRQAPDERGDGDFAVPSCFRARRRTGCVSAWKIGSGAISMQIR